MNTRLRRQNAIERPSATKLFMLAQTSISVPSTEKCSLESRFRLLTASDRTITPSQSLTNESLVCGLFKNGNWKNPN
jgi:hypothetical protein